MNNNLNDTIFYKILPEDLTHNGVKYQLGLNVDNAQSNEEDNYGFSFYTKDYVLNSIYDFANEEESTTRYVNGLKIAVLYVPRGYDVKPYRNDAVYKSHAIYIKEFKNLFELNTTKWIVKNRIIIYLPYVFNTIRCGHLDIVDYMFRSRSIMYSTNLYPFSCSEYNYQKIEYGNGIFRVFCDHSTLHAAHYNHFDIVKYLLDHGLTGDVGGVIFNACENNNIEIVKYAVPILKKINYDKYTKYLDFYVRSTSDCELKYYLLHG